MVLPKPSTRVPGERQDHCTSNERDCASSRRRYYGPDSERHSRDNTDLFPICESSSPKAVQHVARKEAAATVGGESDIDDLNLTAFHSGDDIDDGGPPSDEATTSSINYKPSLCVASSEQGVDHLQDWEPEEQRCSSDKSLSIMWQQCHRKESSDSAAGIDQQRYDIDGYEVPRSSSAPPSTWRVSFQAKPTRVLDDEAQLQKLVKRLLDDYIQADKQLQVQQMPFERNSDINAAELRGDDRETPYLDEPDIAYAPSGIASFDGYSKSALKETPDETLAIKN